MGTTIPLSRSNDGTKMEEHDLDRRRFKTGFCNEGDGIYAIYKICDSYIICNGDDQVMYTCSQGSYFSLIEGSCQAENIVLREDCELQFETSYQTTDFQSETKKESIQIDHGQFGVDEEPNLGLPFKIDTNLRKEK